MTIKAGMSEVRLIDADNTISVLKILSDKCYDDNAFEQAISVLESVPTVDAVQVVRCKDCVHRDPEDHRCDCGGHEWVKGKILPVKDDWFCADGARMDGEEKNDD